MSTHRHARVVGLEMTSAVASLVVTELTLVLASVVNVLVSGTVSVSTVSLAT